MMQVGKEKPLTEEEYRKTGLGELKTFLIARRKLKLWPSIAIIATTKTITIMKVGRELIIMQGCGCQEKLERKKRLVFVVKQKQKQELQQNNNKNTDNGNNLKGTIIKMQ